MVYALFKFRKSKNTTRRRGGIFRKSIGSSRTQIEDLVSLLVVQNLLGKESQNVPDTIPHTSVQKKNEIEQMKQEVLALFDGE